jgi:ABC-2 type transport system permease protein
MRELLIVLQREFVERVRSRSFIISTILTPVLISLFALGPALVERARGGGTHHLAFVEEGGGVAEAAAALLQAQAPGQSDDRFLVEIVHRPAASVADSLSAAVTAGALDAYALIPADVSTSGSVEIRSEDAVGGSLRRRIEGALSSAVQSQRLRAAGLRPGQLAAVLQPVHLEVTRITPEGESAQSESGLLLSVLVGFFLYMLILLYGSQVMQSVQEEKQNRIAEVLVSSVKASQLMLGKVLGVGLAALLQVAIWVSLAAAFLSHRESLGDAGIPAGLLSAFGDAEPRVLISALVYMLLGFFLYATLFAAVGAAMASSEDAQRFTIPLILPLVIPMMMADEIVSAPGVVVAKVLGWIPLTSPLVMPMRIGAGGASTAEILGTTAFLALSVVAIGWVAGKIYRVGILSTGKRASLADLARWIRMA